MRDGVANNDDVVSYYFNSENLDWITICSDVTTEWKLWRDNHSQEAF